MACDVDDGRKRGTLRLGERGEDRGGALGRAAAAKCIYVGMSAGIAGPLLTTPGADFDDDRHLAALAGYAVGREEQNLPR